ncbi:MAG: site-specific integrase, partial [Pirellulales bacterium]
MPKLNNATPKYCKHKASGQAVVTIAGRDHYLGPHGTKASKIEYDRLIGEWLAAGRPSRETFQTNDLTVAELAAAYWKFANQYYRKNGKATMTVYGVKVVLKHLRTMYGRSSAEEFGPLALKAIRQRMVDSGLARTSVNNNIARIRRIFKWAASEEMVTAAVYQALMTVDGLRKGKSEARETAPVLPVADDVVEQTLAKLPAVVADMVRLQRLTGCRPGEVCILRPCDVDVSGDVWAYRPESHKMEHHGRQRVIFIGPKAQEALRPYLLRDKAAHCFSPMD